MILDFLFLCGEIGLFIRLHYVLLNNKVEIMPAKEPAHWQSKKGEMAKSIRLCDRRNGIMLFHNNVNF